MRTTVKMQAQRPVHELPKKHATTPQNANKMILVDLPKKTILKLQERDYPDDDVIGVPSCCFDY
ncbi:hypothetical protein [Olivibacter sp. XZL3]|uniref:hypothetical protein n=1 Tax=Olivibacter sp. XZL3 TaxID=1735116 RepID=UPI001065ECA1|nr:hypothetical protein [Olivibacter sp. XZL3]